MISIVSLAASAAIAASAHGVTVQPGDTLSGIAASHGESLAAVEQANPSIADPNLIYAGQTVYLTGGSSYSAPAPVHHYTPVHHGYASPSHVSTGGGGFRSCVISRESGGNPRAVNPSSGAGGLYQFTPSTWHALGHGGSPQNASVSEQNAAFNQAYAQYGVSPWQPSDGCR